MTSLDQIPFEDIKEFLLANNKNFQNKEDAYREDAYRELLILFKNRKAKGHTKNILEWLIAHNLHVNKVRIPVYTSSDINNMSQTEINKLAKLLTMKGNNINNIKNILRYLHKLDETGDLHPEITNLIFSNLEKLEEQDINITDLTTDDIINLLKTHRNKNLIRRLVYDNMKQIIFSKFLNVDYSRLDDLIYLDKLYDGLPAYVILELFEENKENITKKYTEEEINDFSVELEEYINQDQYPRRSNNINIYVEDLTKFLVDLIKLKEIKLAKQVFDISNKYKIVATITHSYFTFNQYLVNFLLYQKDNIDVLKHILDFIGEDIFDSLPSSSIIK